VVVQPGLEGLRGPLVQQVNRPPGLDIDKHGAVDVPAAQREIIDAQHPRDGGAGIGQGADRAQQRRVAGRRRQPAAQPRAGPAAQRQRNRCQRLAEPGGAPGMPAGQAGDLLGERAALARVIAAGEPADLQVD
jgi:hypothetical protein